MLISFVVGIKIAHIDRLRYHLSWLMITTLLVVNYFINCSQILLLKSRQMYLYNALPALRA
ncbi:hypothetical protein BDN70DRAFT_200355 [Pholiota conissans]|uniref:Uncharacterized protein n=1 Tax=Pholiota conissans TaxID=109636 RepID=A0A9P5YUF9_9AGAR|nr:hypothetical protein BDN70DRAFT_200355 [Pholiota conissans]